MATAAVTPQTGREPVPGSTASGAAPRLHRRAAALAWLVGCAAAGAALGLAFPPVGWWPLAPLAVACLVLLVHSRGLRAGVVAGLVFGTAFFLVLLPWLTVIGVDAYLALVAVEAAWVGVLGGALGVVTRLRGWPVWVACCWVGDEVARAHLPLGGFPWGSLAFATAGTPLARLEALGGDAATGFTVALAGALLAAGARRAWAARAQSTGGARAATIAAACVLGAVAATLVGGLVPTPIDGPSTTVAIVQGNVPRAGLNFLGRPQQVLANHVAATLRLARQVATGQSRQPAVVVWPENASDVDPATTPSAAVAISAAVDAARAPTLVGAVLTNPADPSTVLNAGLVWLPGSGRAHGPESVYVKRHLVPFGEYVPYRRLLTGWISELARIPRDFVAGDTPGLLRLGNQRVGEVICFEVAYDPLVAAVGREPLLVVQTNNADYAATGQPAQQLAITRLRAVEHGRSVVVAATTGISGVVRPDGSMQVQGPTRVAWVWDGSVTLRTGLTVADRVGQWPAALSVTVAALAVAVAVTTSRRSRRRATS